MPTILSEEKVKEIVEELKRLMELRPSILRDLDDARQLGDLSENAEYTEAKKNLYEIDKKCSKLNSILKDATILDTTENKNKNFVDLFANVTLKNTKDGKEKTYLLVSEEESSLVDNKISITSPLGSILKNKRVNDIVELNAPCGIIKYEILEIKYN